MAQHLGLGGREVGEERLGEATVLHLVAVGCGAHDAGRHAVRHRPGQVLDARVAGVGVRELVQPGVGLVGACRRVWVAAERVC